MKIPACLLAALWLLPVAAGADELFDELAQMDQRRFQAAFVDCDQEAFAALFTEDAELYHDRAGASFGKEATRLHSCPRDNGIRRILVPGSLKVYPMKDYGAVQTGEHWFVEEGAETSMRALFVHLWRRTEDGWRLARVLSFDQNLPKQEGPQ